MVTKKQGYLIGAQASLLDALDLINTTAQMGLGTREDANAWDLIANQLHELRSMMVNDPNARRADLQVVDLTAGELNGVTKKAGKLLVAVDKLADSKTYPRNVHNKIFSAVRKAFEQLQEAQKA